MKVVGEYSVDDFVFAMTEGSGNYVYFKDGGRFKRNSQRMQLFFEQGFECVYCGMEGNVFALESSNGETPHLNLYYVGENSEGKVSRILFTKDHILPKSRGGANELKNYQVMCQPCNARKGNSIEN